MKNYFEEILPNNQTEISEEINERIKNAVREKIEVNGESEEKKMNTKVKRRTLKTAFIAAAVVAASAVSVIGANAATDGALFEKVSIIIDVNGEDVEKDAVITADGNATTIAFNDDGIVMTFELVEDDLQTSSN